MAIPFTPTEDPDVMAAWAEVAPAPGLADFIAAREYPAQPKYFSDPVFPEQFISVALRRNDSLVTLALALHCDSPRALGQIWRSASEDGTFSKALRRAVLANPHSIFDLTDEEWRDFVLTADAKDIASYCRKPIIQQEGLAQILAGEKRFADLPEERRLMWAFAALKNPNLHRIRPDPMRYPVDGWWDYAEGKPLEAALKLLEWVPVSQAHAWALAAGIGRFPRKFDAPVPVPKGILEKISGTESERQEWEEWHRQANLDWLSTIMNRWTVPEEETREDTPAGGTKSPHPNGCAHLRMAVARLIEGFKKELRMFVETHSDKWVRIGAIASKDFRSAEEVRSVIEREGFLALCHVYDNPAFHRRSDPRVVAAFRSFYGTRASQMAKAEGYDWDDTRFAHSWYDQTADRLHTENPGAYYSADESPDEDVDHPEDDLFSDELPKPQRQWLLEARMLARRHRDKGELGEIVMNLAEKITRIQADSEAHRRDILSGIRNLMTAIGSTKMAAWAAAIIASVVALRLLF